MNPEKCEQTQQQSETENNDLYDLNQVFLDNPHYITAYDENKNVNKDDTNEEVEYYCTYEDVNRGGVYFEPDLPPRRGTPDDVTTIHKKQSAFSKFTKKFKNFNFKTKLTQHSNAVKKSDDVNVNIVSEPIYDTVNYTEINNITIENNHQELKENPDNIVQTLLVLKQTLEEKKLKVKEVLESSTQTKQDPPEMFPPGLPPRTGSRSNRSSSPYHDTPKNNSPVSPQFPNTIDKILNDLQQQQQQLNEEHINEELNVQQLIKKFNNTEIDDVNLRQKSDKIEDETTLIINRYSEDLNKLLEELTKVTSAPLLTPGVTSSLIQMKSPPVTDEEWLALTPIRRRRFSDPDYDVPRPHRSLQILPTDDTSPEDEVIPATRFFGPVLSETCRSMTPDSLEPAQLRRNLPSITDSEKDRSLGYEERMGLPKMADCHVFMDSLEPLTEGATAF